MRTSDKITRSAKELAAASRLFRCMSLNMFRKPLLRLGVKLCCSPSMPMKLGCRQVWMSASRSAW